METGKVKTIDEYIAGFPGDTRLMLEQVRDIIRTVAPDAVEGISYGIPTFRKNDTYLVYFAGYKNHVSVYPAPKGNDALAKQLIPYRAGKGTLQFSLNTPLPATLIKRVVQHHVKENKARGVKSRPSKSRKTK